MMPAVYGSGPRRQRGSDAALPDIPSAGVRTVPVRSGCAGDDASEFPWPTRSRTRCGREPSALRRPCPDAPGFPVTANELLPVQNEFATVAPVNAPVFHSSAVPGDDANANTIPTDNSHEPHIRPTTSDRFQES